MLTPFCLNMTARVNDAYTLHQVMIAVKATSLFKDNNTKSVKIAVKHISQHIIS